MFVFLCVAKDLANRWTYMVLLKSEASTWPAKVFNNFIYEEATAHAHPLKNRS